MKPITAAMAAMLLASVAQAQPLSCFPPPIDTCGKGVVRGTTDGVEWIAWWIETNFEWRRVHGYRLLDAPSARPEPGAGSAGSQAGDGSAASAAHPANPASPGNSGMRSCNVAPHKEALAACQAMTIASDKTLPPAILYNVDRANGKDGTRPGHRLDANGVLVADGQRHRAGAWCECWRGATKSGSTQYCLVTKTASYAACRRVQ